MGAVLLQGGSPRAGRADAQKSTGLHRHEPDRLESGTSDIGGELVSVIIDRLIAAYKCHSSGSSRQLVAMVVVVDVETSLHVPRLLLRPVLLRRSRFPSLTEQERLLRKKRQISRSKSALEESVSLARLKEQRT